MKFLRIEISYDELSLKDIKLGLKSPVESFPSINLQSTAPHNFKVSVKQNEVPTAKNSSRKSIFATKVSYLSN